jgi:hypothetical protein
MALALSFVLRQCHRPSSSGAMSLGRVTWRQAATLGGLPIAHFVAAARARDSGG